MAYFISNGAALSASHLESTEVSVSVHRPSGAKGHISASISMPKIDPKERINRMKKSADMYAKTGIPNIPR